MSSGNAAFTAHCLSFSKKANMFPAMQKHAIRNGSLIDERDAVMPITVREVQSNYSVYEALRVIDRHVVHLDDHIKRLENSASQIGLALPYAPWQEWIELLVEADGIADATMRILVYGTPEPVAFITWEKLLSYPESCYEQGVAVTTYHGERFLPTCKTSNLLLSYLALDDARAKGAFEALLIDREGRVTEGTRSNFYLIDGKRLYTAPDQLVLSGITRISVLRAARVLGYEVVMEAPLEKDLGRGCTMFISSTSMAAMPVSAVDAVAVSCDIQAVLAFRDLVRAWEKD